jgi:hypothetical protein
MLYQFSKIQQHIQTPKPKPGLAFLITNYVDAERLPVGYYELQIGITLGECL